MAHNKHNNNNINLKNMNEMKKWEPKYKSIYVANSKNNVTSKLACEEADNSDFMCKSICCDVCAIGFSLLFGFMFLTLGLLTTYFPLSEHSLNENLKFSPLFPQFHLWKNPVPEVLLKVYIFNITNAEDFIAGKDEKLKLQEIGPIIFQETLEHKDIQFHDENSTMSYTVSRQIIFKESANLKGILNETVYVVNMALSAASYINKSFFMRRSYNILLRTLQTKPVVSTTIYNYFFNMTDPILQLANTVVPFIAPTKDTGILQNIYKNFTDRVNVNIGLKHGHKKFFTINTWNDHPTVPRFDIDRKYCNASLKGSTEGAIYSGLASKDTVFWFWRKTLCRPVPLFYDSELSMYNLKAYKYILRYDVFDRNHDTEVDCYKGENLPDGLSDVSKCFFDQPIAASFPHFCNRSGPWDKYIDGLSPNMSIHDSYTIVEPNYGVPMKQKAVSQSNVILKDLSSYKSDFARFSNMIIPMFWLEYYQDGLSPIIISLLNFSINTLPRIQFWISGLFIIVGLCLLMVGYLRLRKNEKDIGGKLVM
ncbi:lysosome membrane protein 2-like isoform X1 [Chironomus tepperi]|uniref:lysosome membrane protein 2-like isoform X1 n=1 Tax=Chironomus tepperi TaxID=113505 RepID=UPI00391F0A1C